MRAFAISCFRLEGKKQPKFQPPVSGLVTSQTPVTRRAIGDAKQRRAYNTYRRTEVGVIKNVGALHRQLHRDAVAELYSLADAQVGDNETGALAIVMRNDYLPGKRIQVERSKPGQDDTWPG